MFETFYDFFTKLLAIGMYIIIPLIIVFKVIKRKKLPNNEYTPYDDLLLGRTRRESYTKEMIQEDLQHEIRYDEPVSLRTKNSEK